MDAKTREEWRQSASVFEDGCVLISSAVLLDALADSERAERLEVENKVLRDGLLAVEELIGDSYGVVGLHRNGDTAKWDELRTGGRYEDWLLAYDKAHLQEPPHAER